MALAWIKDNGDLDKGICGVGEERTTWNIFQRHQWYNWIMDWTQNWSGGMIQQWCLFVWLIPSIGRWFSSLMEGTLKRTMFGGGNTWVPFLDVFNLECFWDIEIQTLDRKQKFEPSMLWWQLNLLVCMRSPQDLHMNQWIQGTGSEQGSRSEATQV